MENVEGKDTLSTMKCFAPSLLCQSSVRLSEKLLKLGVIQWFCIKYLIDSFLKDTHTCLFFVFLFYFLSVLLIRFASIAFRADSIFASLSFWAFCSSIRSWNSVFFRLSTLLFIICSQSLEKKTTG